MDMGVLLRDGGAGGSKSLSIPDYTFARFFSNGHGV